MARTKGSLNKFTAKAKDAFAMAFAEMGGPKALTAWGKKNPGEFYKLYARLIPTEVAGADGIPLTVRVVRDP